VSTSPDPARLAWFQDQKFGLFVHWGPYSQKGCLESWPLVWKDRSWSNPAIQTREQMEAFRREYWALPTTFNPERFDPSAWARLAKMAGMKYVVLTTKHHDGFAMFDTKLSDYRVTHPSVPFSKHRRANIARELFNAFRAEDLAVGAYFSKPDWRHPDYWEPGKFAEDRHPTYDPQADPAKWSRYAAFVQGQIRELVADYGRIDILWLDGGWVRPPKQAINLAKIVADARAKQPWLLVANRTGGEFEDFLTPEQKVSQTPVLDKAWESCMTMGAQWSYSANDTYKPARTLMHTLIDVVAKGGNLLLNIGPGPDGQLPPPAVARLEEIGEWMAVNFECVHGTRPLAPYREGDWAYTRRGDVSYAIWMPPNDEVPAELAIPKLAVPEGARVMFLGARGSAALQWTRSGEGIVVKIPDRARTLLPCRYAYAFRVSGRERQGVR
jgi:alpha-L-fucosidase